ncbi:P21 prophage-derived protein NinB (fragment) [Paraburkholderia piptadeniae]|uniref:P21 prophage-derived protein NinB n=1 Tax=Paraburkholderia piptadeniae TaxID=1701573 RepID=A0A1N7ST47_9BURK
MDKKIFTLTGTNRRLVAEAIRDSPNGHMVVISEPTRSLDQNALLWPLLTEVSRQVVWYGRRLTPNQWKSFFTAALSGLDVVPNIDGTGFVALGEATSTMSKRKFSDLIELIFAFGADREVRFAAPKDHYLGRL